jgi:hypothetical protein
MSLLAIGIGVRASVSDGWCVGEGRVDAGVSGAVFGGVLQAVNPIAIHPAVTTRSAYANMRAILPSLPACAFGIIRAAESA